MGDWTSNAHKAFVTEERGMVALELVSDCSPVQRMHLHLTPLEARSLAAWLNAAADDAGGTSHFTKSCSFCGEPCAEPLDRVCRECAVEKGPIVGQPMHNASSPSPAEGE